MKYNQSLLMKTYTTVPKSRNRILPTLSNPPFSHPGSMFSVTSQNLSLKATENLYLAFCGNHFLPCFLLQFYSINMHP